jgi:hypothetical protein
MNGAFGAAVGKRAKRAVEIIVPWNKRKNEAIASQMS